MADNAAPPPEGTSAEVEGTVRVEVAGTVHNLVPAQLPLPSSPGEPLEPAHGAARGGASGEHGKDSKDTKELAAAQRRIGSLTAERDAARAKEKELHHRVTSLEKELRAERSRGQQLERQLHAMKLTNAQLMRLRQDEQNASSQQQQQQHQQQHGGDAHGRQRNQSRSLGQQGSVGGAASRDGRTPPPAGGTGSERGADGRGRGGARGAGSGAHAQRSGGRHVPPAAHAAGGERGGAGAASGGPAAGGGGGGGGGRGEDARQTQGGYDGMPPANDGATVPPLDAAAAARAELREALVTADAARLQAAVLRAEGLGLEREAAHGRKKMATLGSAPQPSS